MNRYCWYIWLRKCIIFMLDDAFWHFERLNPYKLSIARLYCLRRFGSMDWFSTVVLYRLVKLGNFLQGVKDPLCFRSSFWNAHCYFQEVHWVRLWELNLNKERSSLQSSEVPSFWPLSESRKWRVAPCPFSFSSLSMFLSSWPLCLLLYKRNDLNFISLISPIKALNPTSWG